jgi:hypothetical protein
MTRIALKGGFSIKFPAEFPAQGIQAKDRFDNSWIVSHTVGSPQRGQNHFISIPTIIKSATCA